MIGWKSILPTVLMFTVAVNTPLMQVLAQSLSAENIEELANKFVVQIDGSNGGEGSGFIVRKNGRRYTVLTNHHVVKSSTQYTVTTSDGQKYIAQNIKVIGNVDLAEIEFVSNRDYTVAPLSTNVGYPSSRKVYAYGWNAVSEGLTERVGQPLEGRITGSLSKGLNGYTLMMTLQTLPGMSGSPLLNEKGEVIGVYGSTDVQKNGEVQFLTLSLGIPISTYQRYSNITRSIPNNTIPTKTQTPTLDVVRLLLLVKLSQRRVYVYKGDRIIAQYPVVIGKNVWEPPLGGVISQKVVNPVLYEARTGKVIKSNPLGKLWIGISLDGQENVIGFYGTPTTSSIAKVSYYGRSLRISHQKGLSYDVSYHGSLRMSDQDINELFNLVKVDTFVEITN